MLGKLETRVGIFVLAAIGVFIYMGFQIGAFRFDRAGYKMYTMYFNDISDLDRKAKVKIAGVKVGWVEEIMLHADGVMQAEAKVMISKEYKLYKDAHAVVRQEGLLGPKYLEIIPGDSLLPQLQAGDALGKPGVEPVSMDELLRKFKRIASNVEEVTDSLKEAIGGGSGKEQIQAIFDNLQTTAEKMSSFSDIVERAFVRNEDNIDVILSLGADIRAVAQKLESDVLPSFRESVERVSDVLDRDFNRIASKLEATADSIEEASVEARDGLKSVSSVAVKIDEGKGVLGKLINEDETYRDLKVAVQGLKNYFAKVDMLEIVLDSHFESMHRPAENYQFEDAKGYFDVRIHPSEDHFYALSLVTSEKGFVNRHEVHKSYDDEECPVDVGKLHITDRERLEFTYREKRETFTRNTVKFGLQFGKVFNDIALRVGLFEGSAGLGVDVDIPFRNDNFRWVTTLEAFDFTGWNRKEDRRPHLKWLNRMFLLRNIYMTFGADDFISKRNASAFLGAGIRFGDDDIKYLVSSIGGARSIAS